MSHVETIRELIHQSWNQPQLLDEIEARATAYLHQAPYLRHDRESDTGRVRVWTGSGEPIRCLNLATSRDALAEVRAPYWWLHEVTPSRFIGERKVEMRAGVRHVDAWVESDFCPTPLLAELHCLLLAWQYEREKYPAGEPAPIGLRYATIVRLDPGDARILDILAKGAGVPSTVMLQRLAAHALFDPRMREAAHLGSPGNAGSSPNAPTHDRA